MIFVPKIHAKIFINFYFFYKYVTSMMFVEKKIFRKYNVQAYNIQQSDTLNYHYLKPIKGFTNISAISIKSLRISSAFKEPLRYSFNKYALE